jgi:hypothetical protein
MLCSSTNGWFLQRTMVRGSVRGGEVFLVYIAIPRRNSPRLLLLLEEEEQEDNKEDEGDKE